MSEKQSVGVVAISLKTADLCAHLNGHGYARLKAGDKLYADSPESVMNNLQEFLQKNKLCLACFDEGFIFYRWDETRNRSAGLQKTAWDVSDVLELLMPPKDM